MASISCIISESSLLMAGFACRICWLSELINEGPVQVTTPTSRGPSLMTMQPSAATFGSPMQQASGRQTAHKKAMPSKTALSLCSGVPPSLTARRSSALSHHRVLSFFGPASLNYDIL